MVGVAYLENDDFTDDGKLKINSEYPVMILLQGDYCGYCTQFKPEFLKAVKVLKDKVDIATIQLDGEGSESVLGKRASKFIPNFKGVPMVVFFVNGKYYSTFNGERTADALVKYVRENF